MSGGTPLSQLDVPDNENRPENTFAVEEEEGKNTVHIYFRQQGSGVRVFRISYRVENAVKLHSDVGEFFWNLTGETGISGIGTLTATLTVPGGVPAEDFLVWAISPPLCKGRLHVACREGGIVRCAYAGRLQGWLRCASHCLSSGTGFFREVFIMRRYTYPRAGGSGGKKQLSGFPRLIF